VPHLGIRGSLRTVREDLFLWRWRRKVKAHRFAHFGKRSLIVSPRGILSPHRIEIGDGVLIHEGAMFSVVEHWRGRDHEPRLRIGSGTNIGAGIWFSCVGEIDIGENNLMGHNILIADSYHEYEDPDTPIIFQPMTRRSSAASSWAPTRSWPPTPSLPAPSRPIRWWWETRRE